LSERDVNTVLGVNYGLDADLDCLLFDFIDLSCFSLVGILEL